jgi:hypothetical protein
MGCWFDLPILSLYKGHETLQWLDSSGLLSTRFSSALRIVIGDPHNLSPFPTSIFSRSLHMSTLLIACYPKRDLVALIIVESLGGY